MFTVLKTSFVAYMLFVVKKYICDSPSLRTDAPPPVGLTQHDPASAPTFDVKYGRPIIQRFSGVLTNKLPVIVAFTSM